MHTHTKGKARAEQGLAALTPMYFADASSNHDLRAIILTAEKPFILTTIVKKGEKDSRLTMVRMDSVKATYQKVGTIEHGLPTFGSVA